MSDPNRTHAIVVGGSMAGLLAARALADYFDRVTIVERDTLPDGPEFRNGAPQSRHLHVLLARGQQSIESLFPGISAELSALGAPRVMWARDTEYYGPGGWLRRFESGIETNIIFRASFEWLVRKRLLALPNVALLGQYDVQELLTDETRTRVTGVRVESRADHATRDLHGDLVIDASGRNAKTPEWLRALGYDAPPETNVNAYLGYSTCIFERPANPPDWKVLFINLVLARGVYRGGVLFEIEGGRWMVTMAGLNKDYPPTDLPAFLEFAKTLAHPALYEVLKDARPLTQVWGYRVPGSRLRHYERLTRRPENFVVLGDAVCSFNPFYGQGMTVAAMEALELHAMLKGRDVRKLSGFAASFQKRLAGTLKNAWTLATGEDLRYPGTEGDRPNAAVRAMQKYVDALLQAISADETISKTFMQVQNMLKPPTALFHPAIVWRVLRYHLTGRARSVPEKAWNTVGGED